MKLDRVEENLMELSQKLPFLKAEQTPIDGPHSRVGIESSNGLEFLEEENSAITAIENADSESPHLVGPGFSWTDRFPDGTHLVPASNTSKWTKVSQKRLNFWLVKVELEKHEERREIQRHSSNGQTDQNLRIQRSSIRTHIRVPFLTRKVIVEMQNLPFSSSNGFDLQFRTRNIVPGDSPILVACDNLDFSRVKELLKTKAASPFDYYSREVFGDCSLANRMIRSVLWKRGVETSKDAVDLINYLLPLYSNDSQMVNYDVFNHDLALKLLSSMQTCSPTWIDMLRAILHHSKDNPFESELGYSVGIDISTSNASYPLPSFLLEQSYHAIDVVNRVVMFYWENDRTMLSDPKGEIMQERIKAGCQYGFFNNLCGGFGDVDAMYGLLRAASDQRTPEVESCCRIRLSFLLQLGYDISGPHRFCEHPIWRRATLSHYAFELNLASFLADVLSDAGWQPEAINDLFDEEQYYGVPELLDGKVEYMTRDMCRKEFVIDLIEGNFLETSDISRVLIIVGLSIGMHLSNVDVVIKEANNSFRQKLVPGSWHDGGDIRLVPGFDFNPFLFDWKLRRHVDMREWLREDTELTSEDDLSEGDVREDFTSEEDDERGV